jgi:hypothetical protein
LPEVALDNFTIAEQLESPPVAVIPKLRIAATQLTLPARSVRVEKVEIDRARLRASREGRRVVECRAARQGRVER